MRARTTVGLSADAFSALVRVDADRVHDFVRRQGCSAAEAAGVVEASAVALVQAEVATPLAEPTGTWFALADDLAARAGGRGDAALPIATGPLAADGEQELLAVGLARRRRQDRAALLLRDAYDLPIGAVAEGLGLDEHEAQRVVGAARLELLPDVFAGDVPAAGAHGLDDAVFARLADGTAGPGDGSATRHLRGCAPCGEIVHAQRDVRRLLAGLAVVALADDAREGLLERVGGRARAALPAHPVVVPVVVPPPPRLLAPGPVVVALVAALLAGVGIGALLGNPTTVQAAPGPLPAVTAPPVSALPSVPASTGAPAPGPTTTVFTYPPVPTTPPPTTSAPPPTTPPPTSAAPTAAPAVVTVTPASGAAGARVAVSGTGWTPGATVQVGLLDSDDHPFGDTVRATATADGRFRVSLVAGVAGTPPGPCTVRAQDGSHTASTPYAVV